MNFYYTENQALIMSFILCILSIPAALHAVKRKNRSIKWVFLSILFLPLFFVIECLSNKSQQTIQMIACKACQKEISPASKHCPHCGHPNDLYHRTKASLYEWFIGGLILITIIFWLIIPPVSMINGLPSCDASFSKELARNTLKQITTLHIEGIFAIDLNNIKEINSSSEERKCSAYAKLSNDTEHTITYTLSKQEDNKIYIHVQLDD